MTDTSSTASDTTALPPLVAPVTIPQTTTDATDTAPKHAAVTIDTDPEQDLVTLPGVGQIDLRTSVTPAAPQLTLAADGTTRLVLTWTKNTKAHVGTAIAALTGLGELATTYVLPATSPYTHWCQVALGVVGLAATWLGIQQTTNLPKPTSKS